ncbi:hypothetical protein DESC_580054 [Desulfosarcina cetonica]|uniref:hypothetical protein n=1 Tax=Desulfosarcina cetonica TaxID=90730 RepID=UPI0006D02DDB|nr:hypothetical protein [Desulfosarcina cetonica]VTR67011.1 hypothetical protein DESC_580054 [Desulfosarcina cetonica]
MGIFEKDAFKLENYIRKRLPLFAKATESAKNNDSKLAKYFVDDNWIKFGGVVFHSGLKEVYCTFYDDFKKCATLVSVIDLKFMNIKVHNEVKKFKNKYYGKE